MLVEPNTREYSIERCRLLYDKEEIVEKSLDLFCSFSSASSRKEFTKI